MTSFTPNMSQEAQAILLLTLSQFAPKQGTPEWLAQRFEGIGASETDALLKNPDRYIAEKLKGTSFTGNEFTRWGHEFEKVAADLYAIRHNFKTHELASLPSQEKSFIRASLDRLVEEPSNNGSEASYHILEIKCPSRRMPTQGKIPEGYKLQMQQQMYVSGFHNGVFLDCNFRLFADEASFTADTQYEFGKTKGALILECILTQNKDAEPIYHEITHYPPKYFGTPGEWKLWVNTALSCLPTKEGVEYKVHWWFLETVVEVPLQYNKEAFEKHIPTLEDTWLRLKKAQENPQEFLEKYVGREKKAKKEALPNFAGLNLADVSSDDDSDT